MDKPTTRRCHGCCGKRKQLKNEGCKVLEHTSDFTFKSP